jgi:hypothetical protein
MPIDVVCYYGPYDGRTISVDPLQMQDFIAVPTSELAPFMYRIEKVPGSYVAYPAGTHRIKSFRGSAPAVTPQSLNHQLTKILQELLSTATRPIPSTVGAFSEDDLIIECLSVEPK